MTDIKNTALEFGLKNEEYDLILKLLGREPNLTEIGVISSMWSEHCSYKSSKIHLSKLPSTSEYVIQGPGENAGVIDIGDGDAIIFKIESHNHPSYIEPFQGAATGVGGIMRDIFTMGARPIANLNALHFGAIDHKLTPYLVNGVVDGISSYGNCMGVPTVGGLINFSDSYNGNILVNAMTIGICKKDKIFTSKQSGIGNPVIYVGSKTGRDGIHGASMASAEFDDESHKKRPTVQVGDPFAEKLLLEACLELMKQDYILAIQDMGAAGLTSSSVEMAAKAKNIEEDILGGISLDLDHVPCREKNMTSLEIMLSESQERMLMILKPGTEEKAKEIFKKWELDFAVIGKTTNNGNITITQNSEIVCDLPVDILVDHCPKFDRPRKHRQKKNISDIFIKVYTKRFFISKNSPSFNKDKIIKLISNELKNKDSFTLFTKDLHDTFEIEINFSNIIEEVREKQKATAKNENINNKTIETTSSISDDTNQHDEQKQSDDNHVEHKNDKSGDDVSDGVDSDAVVSDGDNKSEHNEQAQDEKTSDIDQKEKDFFLATLKPLEKSFDESKFIVESKYFFRKINYANKAGFDSILTSLAKILSLPEIAEKKSLYERYDHTVMADTITNDNASAAIIRVMGNKKYIATCVNTNPYYCYGDPYNAGKQILCESYRKLSACGAKPMAYTNCLNFGNPEKPEIMAQFADIIKGMSEASSYLEYPVISGNVSLYNETNNVSIHPTPVIGGVGLINDIDHIKRFDNVNEGDIIIGIGHTSGQLFNSVYKRSFNVFDDQIPAVNLLAEKRASDLILSLIDKKLLNSVRAVCKGGFLVSIAKICMKNSLGAILNSPLNSRKAAFWFGEDQARYIVIVNPKNQQDVMNFASKNGVDSTIVGRIEGSVIKLDDTDNFEVSFLKEIYEKSLDQRLNKKINNNNKTNNNTKSKKMAIEENEIRKLLNNSFPDAKIIIKDLVGDKNHYHISIKSDAFKDMKKIEQHKLVYSALGDVVGNELHAVSLETNF